MAKKGDTTTIKAKASTEVDIFAAAESKTTPKTSAKKEIKDLVELKDPGFCKTLLRYAAIEGEVKTLEAEKKGLYAEIKEKGKKEMVKKYDQDGKYSSSFNIKATDGKDSASFMFITADSYAAIDTERAEELKKKFGEKVIEKTTTFNVNAAMVEKYRKVISDFIKNSPDIIDEDRGEIIKASTTLKVAPGTIENLKTMKGKTAEIIDEIVPTMSIKGVKKEA